MRTKPGWTTVFLLVFVSMAGSLWAEVPAWQTDSDWMRLEGRIHHDEGVPALGFRIVKDDESGWPRLKKLNLNDRRTTYTFPTMFCDLGEIRVPGVQKPGKAEGEGDWSHVRISYGNPDRPELSLVASRVCPALVVQTRRNALKLFCERRRFAGFKGRAEQVWESGGPPTMLESSVGGAWTLCWFGSDPGIVTCRNPYPHDGRHWINPELQESDCPVLLSFGSPPRSVSAGEDGLRVQFADSGEPNSVVMLPLRGDLLPLSKETQEWSDGLPQEVFQECEWWSDHLAQVPYAVEETCGYYPDRDATVLTERMKYLKIRDGGTRLAPLPPMAALAMEQGFPMTLTAGGEEVDYVESGAPTFFGPWGGVEDVDSYSMEIPGLGRLVRERRAVGDPVVRDSTLVRELESEIEKMLEAGHLAPWYCARNCYGAGYRCYWRHQTRFTWSNPGETLYVLAQALPLLSHNLQDRVISYMKKERAEYPPEEVVHTPVLEGTRRERHLLGDREIFRQHQDLVNQHNYHIANDLVPEESLYYLSCYYDATGESPGRERLGELRGILEPYLRRQDWATLGFRTFRRPTELCQSGWGGVHDANCHLAGLIGYLRLAERTGDAEADECRGQLARAVLWRYALGRYARYFGERGFYEISDDPAWMAKWLEGSWVGHMITYDWTGPLDDVRQVTRLSPYGLQLSNSPWDRFHPQSVVPFLGAIPELGRFAKRHLKREMRAFSRRYERTTPGWFIAKCRTNINAEFEYLAPEEPYQLFLIRAWVLGESGRELESYLDTPWMARGDLYYIHKLAETVKAYRGWTWRQKKN